MNVVITGDELRKALADLEVAEKNGFMFCLAVLQLTSASPMLDGCRMKYCDLIEKAHPVDPSLSWGRFQGVTRRYKFKQGKLVPMVDLLKWWDDLTVRSINALRNAGCSMDNEDNAKMFVRSAIKSGEIFKWRNCGKITSTELRKWSCFDEVNANGEGRQHASGKKVSSIRSPK